MLDRSAVLGCMYRLGKEYVTPSTYNCKAYIFLTWDTEHVSMMSNQLKKCPGIKVRPTFLRCKKSIVCNSWSSWRNFENKSDDRFLNFTILRNMPRIILFKAVGRCARPSRKFKKIFLSCNNPVLTA